MRVDDIYDQLRAEDYPPTLAETPGTKTQRVAAAIGRMDAKGLLQCKITDDGMFYRILVVNKDRYQATTDNCINEAVAFWVGGFFGAFVAALVVRAFFCGGV